MYSTSLQYRYNIYDGHTLIVKYINMLIILCYIMFLIGLEVFFIQSLNDGHYWQSLITNWNVYLLYFTCLLVIFILKEKLIFFKNTVKTEWNISLDDVIIVNDKFVVFCIICWTLNTSASCITIYTRVVHVTFIQTYSLQTTWYTRPRYLNRVTCRTRAMVVAQVTSMCPAIDTQVNVALWWNSCNIQEYRTHTCVTYRNIASPLS